MGDEIKCVSIGTNTARTIRVVILDCAYDTIQEVRTQRLLGRVFALKILGYRAEYPYGALPVDTTDVVGVHILLCEEKDGELFPLMGFKSITKERCDIHNVPFPVYNVLRGNVLPDHEKALDEILKNIKELGESVAYNSSLTMHPDVRKDLELRKLCSDLVIGLFIKYYQEYKIKNVLAAATLRFKVNESKEFAGFEYLTLNGNRLSEFHCHPFFGEKVVIMHLRKFRSEALFWANQFTELWKNRLTIGVPFQEKLHKKKIA